MPEISFNHFYSLKHDERRTFIVGGYHKGLQDEILGWVSKIHPIYAMILCLASQPLERDALIDRICYFLDMPIQLANSIIDMFLLSSEPFTTILDGHVSAFPTRLLVLEFENHCTPVDYSVKDFSYKFVDAKTERCLKSPLGLVYMVNNTCCTRCCYCYADCDTKCKNMSLQTIDRILSDARNLKIGNVALSGGDFFTRNDWVDVPAILNLHGYTPRLISTKKP